MDEEEPGKEWRKNGDREKSDMTLVQLLEYNSFRSFAHNTLELIFLCFYF